MSPGGALNPAASAEFQPVGDGVVLATSPPVTAVRCLLFACLAAGCQFSVTPATSPDTPDASVGEPGPDASEPGSVGCDTEDSALRLCMTFDGADAFKDQTGRGHDATAVAVATINRSATDLAAGMAIGSTMHVAEATDLDLTGDFAIDMWVAPDVIPAGARYWLLDNNQQYFLSIGDTRKIRCGIGSKVVDARTPIDLSWHHVACSYTAGTGRLQVFVDGNVDGCNGPAVPAATAGGHDGLAIGANLSGTTFTERYVGLLDNVHVYARALGAAEICSTAGRTGCDASCPAPPR